MKRTAALIYGITCYSIFFATFLYTAGFLANAFVPITIDGDGSAPASVGTAIAINVALLGLFGLQHSVMARIGFKRWWTQFVPKPVERSTYVLASSLVMGVLIEFWQPIPTALFSVEGETARAILYGVYAAGLGLVLYATFLIDHFDLFGLRQVVLYFRGKPYTEKRFQTPSLYKHVRHPLYLGWFTVLWATPDMTIGHLVMAFVATAYIIVAVFFEERDLVEILGEPYRSYRETTPKYIPRFARRADALHLGEKQTA